MTRDEAALIIFRGMFIRTFDAVDAARFCPDKWAQAQATVLALFYPGEIPVITLEDVQQVAP